MFRCYSYTIIRERITSFLPKLQLFKWSIKIHQCVVNPLTPNDHNSGRTAPLTPKRCILYICSTNICTEYIKHGIYSPFFSFKMQFVS